MPIYTYKLLTGKGESVAGERAAPSAAVLRQEFESRGLLVCQLDERSAFRSVSGRIPEQFVMLFVQELIALLKAGLTISEALRLSMKRSDQPTLSTILASVYDQIQEGVALSDALSSYPSTFDRIFIAAIKTGERTGELAKVLGENLLYMKKRAEVRGKFKQAMVYPLLLLVVLVIVMLVLLLFILPKFATIYAGFGAELPVATRILLGLVNYFGVLVPAFVLVGVTIAAGVWYKRRSEPGRVQIDRFKESVPFFSGIYIDSTTARMARTLSTLLRGGVPLVEAIRVAQGSIANAIKIKALRDVEQRMNEGSGLASAFREFNLMPETALKMVEVGEATGGLDIMLENVANYYEGRLDVTLGRIGTLIEPLLMLVMGVFVGGIIIAMYLPIFQIAEVIK